MEIVIKVEVEEAPLRLEVILILTKGPIARKRLIKYTARAFILITRNRVTILRIILVRLEEREKLILTVIPIIIPASKPFIPAIVLRIITLLLRTIRKELINNRKTKYPK